MKQYIVTKYEIQDYDDYKHMEIIGNTYDNPELLEVEK